MTATRTDGSALVMGLLARHVPLSLLVDLADPFGPHSSDLYEAERHHRHPSPIWQTVRADFVTPEGAGTPDCAGRHEVCGTGEPCHMRCWASPLVELRVPA